MRISNWRSPSWWHENAAALGNIEGPNAGDVTVILAHLVARDAGDYGAVR